MKKVIRAVSLMVLCVTIFSLCGCGGNKDDALLESRKAAVEQSMMSFVNTLEGYRGMSDAQVAEYVSSLESYTKNNTLTEEQAKMNVDVITAWHEIEGNLGKFKDYGEFEFDSAGKTYTATLHLNYDNREVQLVYVISKKDFEVTGANVEIVYTLGEKMQKAGLNTLMGIGIVFCMLLLMCIVIYAFNIIPFIAHKLNRDKKEKKIEITAFEGYGEDEPVKDNLELIAVIAAAIAASTGTSTDDFVVRSIRRRN